MDKNTTNNNFETPSHGLESVLQDLVFKLKKFDYSECTLDEKIIFTNAFDELYQQSLIDNYYWQYCPFKVYESHYNRILSEFTERYPDATETDFIIDQMVKNRIEHIEEQTFHYSLIDEWVVLPESNEYYYAGFFNEKIRLSILLNPDTFKKIDFTQNKKLEFLNEKLRELNEQNTTLIKEVDNEPDYMDYSESKDPEKFVMLMELGIIDYLKKCIPVEISERKFASLLSTFTGIDKDNLRKMLNGTKNRDHNNKLTPDNINQIRSKLIALGIKPEYFKKTE